MNAMMKQVQQMQAEMASAQEKLKDEVVEASAGGGMVKAKMSGDLRLLELHIDPQAAQAIRPTDRVRIERALEVHALTGRRLSELQQTHGFAEKRYAPLFLHVAPPREILWDRIGKRTREMFQSGNLERETRRLLARIAEVPAAARVLKIIGYGEMASALRGTCSTQQAEERVAARTRRYAKRQGTWFRRDAGFRGIDRGATGIKFFRKSDPEIERERIGEICPPIF